MSNPRSPWLVALVAALIPLGFAAFTQHAWEDYFITLRTSRHLAEGVGLVFNPGERVHTFTSPLGVLVPALCSILAGSNHEEIALWIFRGINASLLAAAAMLTWRRVAALGLGRVGGVTLIGVLFADAKLVDFSINGMETAILVFFTLLLWSELEATPPRASVIAIAVGGLMWTRPDAFILGGAMIVARVAIGNGRPILSQVPWVPLLRGLGIGGALYVPWFAWAWWYYGTPVPHTIVAKAAYTAPAQLSSLWNVPWHILNGHAIGLDLFLPTYSAFGGWPALIQHAAHLLSVVASFAWLVPGLSATARRASLAVFIGMFYLCSIILFPWYVPPWTALAAIAIAFGLDGIHARAFAAGRKPIATLCRVAGLGLIGLQVSILSATAWQMRIVQRHVETGVRRNLGEWLAAHAAPGDTVFLEPLGYIGYFSRLKTYDFPGLSSPEVVAAVRSGARRYADVIARLQPNWVVLRPHEAARPEFARTGALRGYDRVKTWDALPELDAIQFLPGRSWVEGEASFILFHRRNAAPPAHNQ
ncbi:MAG: hypothetical protein EXS37_05530 [Opitutus sp.]|nr:hypothetical protein [Opitutus sp.]